MRKIKKKPDWLKVRLEANDNYINLLKIVKEGNLRTVCQEALCPNQSECWGKRTATIMILGDVCTRSCGFCAVKTGRPLIYDRNEPVRVAEAVKQMKLNYVVITSVNRDELPDQGSEVWANTISEIRKLNPFIYIEVLIPDFKGQWEPLYAVLKEKPDVLGHNLETVPRLYRKVRPQAKYERSLWVLKKAKEFGLITKTGIMVGIGETFDEVIEVMKDAKNNGVDIFTAGQYLQPTKNHLLVERYVEPEEFNEYKKIGETLGFKLIESGPLVRSSYHAEKSLEILLKK